MAKEIFDLSAFLDENPLDQILSTVDLEEEKDTIETTEEVVEEPVEPPKEESDIDLDALASSLFETAKEPAEKDVVEERQVNPLQKRRERRESKDDEDFEYDVLEEYNDGSSKFDLIKAGFAEKSGSKDIARGIDLYGTLLEDIERVESGDITASDLTRSIIENPKYSKVRTELATKGGFDPSMTFQERSNEIVNRVKKIAQDKISTGLQEIESVGDVKFSTLTQKSLEAETFNEAWNYFTQDPVNYVLEIGSRSAAGTLEVLGTGLAGGAVLAVPGFVGGTFIGSRGVEYSSSIVEGLQAGGVDLKDTESIEEALADEDFMYNLYKYANRRANSIASFDALSAGVATKTLAPINNLIKKAGKKTPLGARIAENLTLQLGVQGASGGAGEATAQLVTEGEITKPGIVWAEIAGETITAPVDVGVASATVYLNSKEKNTKFYQDEDGSIRKTTGKIPEGSTEIVVNAEGKYEGNSVPEGTVIIDEDGKPSVFIPDSEVNKSDISEDQNITQEERSKLDAEKIQSVIAESEKGLGLEPMNFKEEIDESGRASGPGVNYVSLLGDLETKTTDQRTSVTGRQLKNPLRRAAILRPLIKELGVPLFEGNINRTYKKPGVLGYYMRGKDLIRMKKSGDLEVVAHEIAHLIDYKNPEIKKFYKSEQFPKEMKVLVNLATEEALKAYGGQRTQAQLNDGDKPNTMPKSEIAGVSYSMDPRIRLSEGFAEFHRLYMTQPEKAKELTPNIYAWYEKWLDGKGSLGRQIRKTAEDMRAWYGQDLLSQFRSKIGDEGSPNDALFGRGRVAQNLRMAVVDDLQGIKNLAVKMGYFVDEKGKKATADPYEIARLTRGAPAVVEGAFTIGVPQYQVTSREVINPETKKKEIRTVRAIRFDKSKDGMPLDQILNIARTNDKIPGDHLELFYNYMYAKSSMELQQQNRQKRFTLPEMKNVISLVEEQHPQMIDAFKKYLKWNEGIVKFAVDGGLLSQKQVSKWRRVQYVPMYNVFTNGPVVGRKRLDNGSVNIRRLFGSDTNLLPAAENILANARMLITETLINEAKIEIVAALMQSERMGLGIEKLLKQTKKVEITSNQVQRFVSDMLFEAQSQGVIDITKEEFNAMSDYVTEEYPDFVEFLSFGNSPRGSNVLQVMNKGKPVEFEVVDPALYKSLSLLKREPKGAIHGFLSRLREVGQNTITLMPKFLLASLWRETFGAFVYSQSGQAPFINTTMGLFKTMRESPEYQDYLANGGGYAAYIDGEASLKRRLNNIKPKSKIKKIITSPADALVALEKFANNIELATKVEEFSRARESGLDPRLAAFRGRELGGDFAMKGTGDVKIPLTEGFNARAFYDSVMFLQPALTGLDRAFRGFIEQENRGIVAFKAGMVGLVAGTVVANSLMNFKDEYDELEEWEKAAYLHVFFRNPITGEVDGIKFPKLYEIAVIMNIAEGAVETFYKTAYEAKDATEAAKEFAQGAFQTFLNLFTTIPTMPYVVRPVVEQLRNLDTFTEAPILSETELRLPSGAQSRIGQSIFLEKFTDTLEDIGVPQEGFEIFTSTPRFEKLIKQVFNTTGEITLSLLDNAVLAFNPELDDKPRKSLGETVFGTWRFKPKGRKFSKAQTEFYNMLKEANLLQNEMRKYIDTNDLEKLEKALQRGKKLGINIPGGTKTAKMEILVTVNKKITELRNSVEDVYYSKVLSIDTKEEAMRDLYQQINDLTADAVESIHNLDKLRESNF